MLLVDDCRLEYPDFSASYSLEVPSGELCAVVGPSGGGKTTLLHMIAGFETPESGTLRFDGRDLRPLPPAKRPIAMLFQDHNLFPHLTARQNIGLGVRPSLRLTDSERARVTAALEAVDLTDLADRRPGEMSGGQRQRVALARALVTEKPLLLLDEPFAALDPGLRRSMIRLVDRIRRQRGITAVLTIHTPEDILDVADRVAFVADGQVIALGPPAEVLSPSRAPQIGEFLGEREPQ
jgi:thiamine transport system ATP-binding protein